MAKVFSRLFTETIDATNDTLYAVGANDILTIRKFTICNNDSADRTVEIWLVPNGSSPDDTNKLIDNKNIPAGYTIVISEAEGHVLDGGGIIYAKASVGGVLTAHGSGIVDS